jgi:hypothetical protein
VRNTPFDLSFPCVALVVGALAGSAGGCAGNDTPSGPRLLIPPSYVFTPGQVMAYIRQNFDQNHNPTATYSHDAGVLDAGRAIGGYADAAIVSISTTGGSVTRSDTAVMAFEGGRLLIYDAVAHAPGRYPPLPVWSTLIDMRLNPGPDTLLSFDSTFTVTMASGHLLHDRVTCSVVDRYAGPDQISAFGAPIINCSVFTRSVNCRESVDTAGEILYVGPVIALFDSVWFAQDIGPVKLTSRGSTLEVDSLGLPFSLSALQVVQTSSSFDSYEVHYARQEGRDALTLREPMYYFPPVEYMVTAAYARNF